MDEGGKGVNQTLIVKDHNSLKKLTQVLQQLLCYIHLFDISLKKKKKKRPKSQIMKKKCHLDFLKSLMCQTSLNRQKPFWDWCWCEATKRSSVHSSGPHFNQDMWQDNRSPSISKMWWHDYGNTSQKRSWVHRHSFWFHARGRRGLGDNLQLMFKPPLLKEMSWITYFF